MDQPSFREKVIAQVQQIPPGNVATYGQIARLIGAPNAARQVGAALYGLQDSSVPWQRVISAKGTISTHKIGFGVLQRALLEQEGVCFDASGHCDLSRYQWQPEQGAQAGLF